MNQLMLDMPQGRGVIKISRGDFIRWLDGEKSLKT